MPSHIAGVRTPTWKDANDVRKDSDSPCPTMLDIQVQPLSAKIPRTKAREMNSSDLRRTIQQIATSIARALLESLTRVRH